MQTVPSQPLVLASTSRYRRELLARLGLPFECVAPGVDEETAGRGLAPEARAVTLALAKARAVAALRPDAVVIGSDQVCALGDELLGKPGSEDAACRQLLRLQGREHRLATAVAVVHGLHETTLLDVTRLHMRALAPETVRRYVAADQPLDCAGSYRIEGLGIGLFDRIESGDQTAIIGLPLLATARTLRTFGFEIP